MKKALSLLMAMVMLLSTVGAGGVVAYSATRMYAQEKLDQIQTITGFVPGKKAIVTGNCYLFVSKVCEKMYGAKYDGEGLYGNYKSYHHSGNYKTVATYTTKVKTPTSSTIDDIKDFFVKYALPGDVIHYGTLTNSTGNTSTHTFMVYSINDTRLRLYHANYQTVDYDSTDCHVDSLYWSSWKNNPTQNEYNSNGSMYSNNRLFYNKMKDNGVGITINRYVNYEDKYIPTNVTKPTVTGKRVNSSTIRLSWDKIMSATRYRVQYKPADGKSYTTVTSEAKDTQYTISGLTPGTKYCFRVCARVDGVWRDYSNVLEKTALPPQMAKLTYSPAKTGLRLDWVPYSDLDGVIVYRSTSSTGTFKKLKTVTTKSSTGCIDTTVEYGKKYYYKFRRYVMVKGKMHYSTSKPLEATYRLGKPQTKFYRESTTSMRFKFVGDGAQDEFVYTIKDSKGNVVKSGTTKETKIVLTKLKLGETYTCRLLERNKFGKSYYSERSFRQMPASSSNIEVSQTSSGILVKYATVDDVTGYYIYRSTGKDSGYTRVGVVDSCGVNSFLDTNIQLNTTYYYKTKRYVVKNGTTYTSSLSTNPSQGIMLSLDSPGNFVVTRKTPTSVSLTWNEVNKATSYIVYYKISGKEWHATQPTEDTHINIGGLTTGKNYVFQVYARNRIGASEPSVQKTVRVQPPQVKGVSLTNKSSGIKISWTKQSGVSGYRIYRSTSKTSGYTAVATVTSGSTTSYTDTGVTVGKRYYYRVRSYVNVGDNKCFGNNSTPVSIVYKK
ncbi:MAG: fibronectin type III domain-containing protein [Eubacterium sp.]